MSAERLLRLMLVGAAGAALAGCSRTYGVSLGPSGNTWRAEQYLNSQGFARVRYQAQPGDVLVVERQHGDSVDRVRFVRGGRSPSGGGGSVTGTTGTGGGVAGPQPSGGVAQNSGYYIGAPSGSIGGGGSSNSLVLEVTSYRVDKNGKRHGIQPSDEFLAHADSVITLVTGLSSAQRK